MAAPTSDQASLLEILNLLSGSSTSAAERRRAEETYKTARRANPDALIASLVQLGQPGAVTGVDDPTREYCFVLLRRLLQPEATDEAKIAFNACSDATKQGAVDLLLKQWGGVEQGQTPNSVRIHQKVGNCLVTLADNVIIPEVSEDGKREEAKWPDLLKTTCIMANGGAANGGVENEGALKLRCNALKVLCELLAIYPDTIRAMSGDMQVLLEATLGHADMAVKADAVELVLSMVKSFKAKEWKVLQKTLPVILGIVEGLAQQKKEEMLREVLESMTECCEYEGLAIFFKPQVQNVATLISKIISAKGDLESETRAAALEFLITLAEQKPKMCTQQYADFPSVLLGCTMNCLLETEFDEESWVAIMEDEEDDEEDELYKLGSEVIDRAIMAFGMKKISESYKEAIRWHNVKSDSAETPEAWRHAVAALSAVSEGVEYVEDDSVLDSLMELCLSKTTHSHTRVRSQAWHALSRVFNDHGDASERWHEKYMAATKQTLAQDPVARVQQKCLGAFLYFGEALESVTMEEYSRDLLQTLVAKLGANDLHRGVREECITSIAVVAGSIGKEFGAYYNDIMPFLKNILQTSTVEKETRLRGKAFECMSLLGVAVGRSKFKQDGSDCLRAMLGEKQSASVVGSPNGPQNLDKKNSEVLSDYLKDAVERIAGVMEEDLGPFLAPLLDTFLRPLDLNNLPKAGGADDDDDDALVLADGQKVKSAVFREMKDSCDVLTTLLQNCKNSFYEGGHIPRVCQVLHLVLKCEDESIRMSLESDEVMEGASDAWAGCVGILAKRDQKTCQDYLIEYCKSQVEVLSKEEDDVEVVGVTAKGIADVLSAACPTSTATSEERALYGDTTRYLDQNTLSTLWGIVKSKMESCLKRREDSLIKGHEWAEGEEEAEGEVGNLENSDEHHDCAIALSQIVGSLMQLNPGFFVQSFLNDVKGLIGFLLDPKNMSPKIPAKDKSVVESKNKILAYFIACDLAEYLKQDSAPVVLDQGFMQKLFGDIQNVSCEVRHAACYCVYLMASLDGFRDVESVAGAAFERLIAVMRGGKKLFGKSAQSRYISTEEMNLADDNLTAAAFQILAMSPNMSTKVGNGEWDLVLGRLPLKADVDMNSQVIAKLIEVTQVQNRADFLGPNQCRVPKIVGVLAETYRSLDKEEEAAMSEEAKANPLSSENLDKKIQGLVASLGEGVIGGMKGSLSAKQWKKVEKIVREARVH